MGSGRSGTSMVAGSLRRSGYYMGDDLLLPTASNPLGYYESRTVNRINEEILAGVMPRRPRGRLERWFRHMPGRDQRWLGRVRVGRVLPCPEDVRERIREQVANDPFCFKDPRFCYTLPVWRPFVGEAVFVCVFRDPARSVNSILADCRSQRYLWNLNVSRRRAVAVWTLVYRHVLDLHRHLGSWLFLHYDQVLEGDGAERLAGFLEAEVDRSFLQKELNRADRRGEVPRRAARTYAELCDLAGFR